MLRLGGNNFCWIVSPQAVSRRKQEECPPQTAHTTAGVVFNSIGKCNKYI